jgi:hypothetical protein
MSRIYTADLSSGGRAASACVDLDGVQALITLYKVHGEISAEVAFRSRPSDAWGEPVRVA